MGGGSEVDLGKVTSRSAQLVQNMFTLQRSMGNADLLHWEIGTRSHLLSPETRSEHIHPCSDRWMVRVTGLGNLVALVDRMCLLSALSWDLLALMGLGCLYLCCRVARITGRGEFSLCVASGSTYDSERLRYSLQFVCRS